MNLFPFPYKIAAGGDILSGLLFEVPKYCCCNKNNPKCKQFYRGLKKTGVYKCPYGFGVEVLDWGGKDLIFTCLNVEKISDRNKTKKYLKSSEFYPRLSYDVYCKYKELFRAIINENKDTFVASIGYATEREQLKEQKELLENTIHEIRKLNTQLKGATSKLIDELKEWGSRSDYLESLNLDVYSIANLMSIRLDTYDLETNPELNLKMSKTPLAIYKKVEKVYKCLRDELSKKNLNIRLEGQSHNRFNANSLLEIAIFIILDNAIKYSPKNKDIIVTFIEIEDRLHVRFRNCGIRPLDEERNKLCNRGQRSKIALKQRIEGRGIGLYLLQQICDSNNVKLKIEIGSESYHERDIRYSPFVVQLSFENMIVNEDWL